VWWAESSDVPGLVAEAGTHDALVAEIRMLVTELIALNLPDETFDFIEIHLVSDQIDKIAYA
jgi:hypothetical protein